MLREALKAAQEQEAHREEQRAAGPVASNRLGASRCGRRNNLPSKAELNRQQRSRISRTNPISQTRGGNSQGNPDSCR